MRTDVYQTLKNRIIFGEYKPGDLIREADIAEEFHISRTPVREVLQNLQYDKLITLLPYRGAQVTYIEFDFFMQVIYVKKALEGMAASLAARYATEEELAELQTIVDRFEKYEPRTDYLKILMDDTLFHRTVRRMSHNAVLSEMVERLQVHMDRFYYYTNYINLATKDQFVTDYTRMINALREHDAEAAQVAAMTHLNDYYEIIKKNFQN